MAKSKRKKAGAAERTKRRARRVARRQARKARERTEPPARDNFWNDPVDIDRALSGIVGTPRRR